MSELRPTLKDISYAYELLSLCGGLSLPPEPLSCLMRLVQYSAACQVWTYSEPSEPRIPKNEEMLARICFVPKKKLRKIWPQIEHFLEDCGDHWRTPAHWVRIKEVGVERPFIPVAVRRRIMERDKWQCSYCGTKEGPFDIDHVIPLAVGGSHDEENLAAACARCNRSKGAKRPEEWIRSFTP